MADKDRLGDKLRDKEKAEEDWYFAQRDREAIEKMRKAQGSIQQPQGLMQCPK
jgi:hypothetical protein